MIDSRLRELLTRLAGGQSSVEEVFDALTESQPPANKPHAPNQLSQIDGATVDIGREVRCGFGEVIYGEGKPAALITSIAKTQLDAGQDTLVTRIDNDAAALVQTHFKHVQHNEVARTLRLSSRPIDPATPHDDPGKTPHVAVVSAGSTDAPVSAEAIETLTWMKIPYTQFDDIGVAGPQRLLTAVPRLQNASAVVVVAGMEGALPSVVAGHLSAPLFGVPTSVGYGAALGGITPLLGMLSSCAAGVAVVNIDAGFKGGYMAGLVVSRLIERSPITEGLQNTERSKSV